MSWIRHAFTDESNDTDQNVYRRSRKQHGGHRSNHVGSFSSPIRSTTSRSYGGHRDTEPNSDHRKQGITEQMIKELENVDFDLSSIMEESDDALQVSFSLPSKNGKNNAIKPQTVPCKRSVVEIKAVKLTDDCVQSSIVPWTQKYCPKSIEHLHSISAPKMDELQRWFQTVYQNPSKVPTQINKWFRLLIVTGPAGCGKTTAIRLIAKSRNIQVHEYLVPASANVLDDLGENNYTSQLQRFRQFVLGTNSSMDGSKQSKLILIKDLPQSVSSHTNLYHEFLDNYFVQVRNPIPIVFIFTLEIGCNKIKDQLFSKQMIIQNNIGCVELNGVGKRAMTKVLNTIVDNQLSKSSMDNVIESCNGDLRNAINVLEFALSCQLDQRHGPSVCKKARKPARTSCSKDLSFCVGGKDSSPLFFHFLGKILYCKRNPLKTFIGSCEQLPVHMAHLQRHPLKENPEKLLNQVCDTNDNLILFLHQNYTRFMNNDITHVAKCINWLSDADHSFSTKNSWNAPILAEYGQSISVRGIMFNVPNAQNSHRSFYSFEKPQYFEQIKKVNEIERLTGAWHAMHNSPGLSKKHLLLDQLPLLVHSNRSSAYTQPFVNCLPKIYSTQPTSGQNKNAAFMFASTSTTSIGGRIVNPDYYVLNPVIVDDE